MFKKFLLGAMAFVFTASAASAADITNPFYLPTQGQIGSITSLGYTRSKSKETFINKAYRSETDEANSYDKQIDETLQFGLTDRLTLIGSIGNSVNKLRTRTSEGLRGSSDTDKNAYFSGGLAWNILTGPARLQLNGAYSYSRGGYEAISWEAKAGYQFLKFLPYVSFAEELPVDQPSGYDKVGYSAKIGLYQGECEKWALDTGIRWLHDEFFEQRGYNAEVEASYYLTPKTAVSIYGTYLLDGIAKHETNLYNKSIGARLRLFFN